MIEKLLNDRVSRMFDDKVIKDIQDRYGYVYNPSSKWVYLLKGTDDNKIVTIFIKEADIEKTLGIYFFELDINTQVKIIEKIFDDKLESNNFKVDKYYIYTSTGKMFVYKTLSELKDNAKNDIEGIDGYIGIGLEYSDKNGDSSLNGIGGIDLIIRSNINDAFVISNDYSQCGLNFTREQKKVFFEYLIKELNK